MELHELNLLLLIIRKQRIVVDTPVADDIRGDALREMRFSGTGRASENQVLRFEQHGGEHVSIFVELLGGPLLPVGHAVCQNELVLRIAEALQTFLHEDNRGENAPTVGDELTSITIVVHHTFDCIVILFEFLLVWIDAAYYFRVGIVFANRKGSLLLIRQGNELFLEYLESDAGKGSVANLLFVLFRVILGNGSVRTLEIDVHRLATVAETQIIHGELFVGRRNALRCNR